MLLLLIKSEKMIWCLAAKRSISRWMSLMRASSNHFDVQCAAMKLCQPIGRAGSIKIPHFDAFRGNGERKNSLRRYLVSASDISESGRLKTRTGNVPKRTRFGRRLNNNNYSSGALITNRLLWHSSKSFVLIHNATVNRKLMLNEKMRVPKTFKQ